MCFRDLQTHGVKRVCQNDETELASKNIQRCKAFTIAHCVPPFGRAPGTTQLFVNCRRHIGPLRVNRVVPGVSKSCPVSLRYPYFRSRRFTCRRMFARAVAVHPVHCNVVLDDGHEFMRDHAQRRLPIACRALSFCKFACNNGSDAISMMSWAAGRRVPWRHNKRVAPV